MLLLDVGNSAIKAQCWKQNRLQSSCRIRVESQWKGYFEDFLSSIDATAACYAGVPGNTLKREIWGCLEQRYGSQNLSRLLPLAKCRKVVNAYPDPAGMGVDRWLAMLGAAALTKKDAMVVDAGSAITIDLLKADGHHLGGAILPGFNTSLARFKQILSVADFNHVDVHSISRPGLSTEQCIHIDYELEDTSYLESLIGRWFDFLADDAVLILCGGDAASITQTVDREVLIAPDLVFTGMRQQLEYCA